jgi:hypothetical protein
MLTDMQKKIQDLLRYRVLDRAVKQLPAQKLNPYFLLLIKPLPKSWDARFRTGSRLRSNNFQNKRAFVVLLWNTKQGGMLYRFILQ